MFASHFSHMGVRASRAQVAQDSGVVQPQYSSFVSAMPPKRGSQSWKNSPLAISKTAAAILMAWQVPLALLLG